MAILRLKQDDALYHTAIHEAGHVAILLRYGFKIKDVSINKDIGITRAYASEDELLSKYRNGIYTHDEAVIYAKELIEFLCGGVAAAQIYKRKDGIDTGVDFLLNGGAHDFKGIYKLAQFLFEKKDRIKVMTQAYIDALMYLAEVWDFVEDIANKLIIKGKISFESFR